MSPSRDPAADLRQMLDAALAAADPAEAVRQGFAAREVALELGRDRPHWIIALGKAAPAMAEAALARCAQSGLSVAGGLVVTHAASEDRLAPEIPILLGDHPVPGVRSAEAAERLGQLVERIGREDVVLLLISGGTSSLIGAPIAGIRSEDLATLHALLLGSGLPIARTNAVRKRFSRWGAGRLAAALECARVIPILLADVPSEDPALVGSGPVSPDPLAAWQVERVLRDAGIAVRVPLSIASTLGAMRAGVLPETPKPDSAAFAKVEAPFVVGNSASLEAAAAAAHALGYTPVLLSRTVLGGDATAAGRALAYTVSRAAAHTCFIWGGETTVQLPQTHGLGGRCQQLALAAAEVLEERRATNTWLLAAGTDGRDGPAPASGALVYEGTWAASRAQGADPGAALARCDAYGALAAADALLPARSTGTNVMDIVVAVRGPSGEIATL